MSRSFARRRRPTLLACVACLACLACTSGTDAPKVPLGQAPPAPASGTAQTAEAAHALIGPAARAALDSGNALFRKKAYVAALDAYRAASALAPQHAAPLFGIYMVARATNNPALADTALQGIRQRNGPLPSAPHGTSDSALRRLHEVRGTPLPPA